MCYRCGICNRVHPSNQPRLSHVVYREVEGVEKWLGGRWVRTKRREVLREVGVCGSCAAALADGVRYDELLAGGVCPPKRCVKSPKSNEKD